VAKGRAAEEEDDFEEVDEVGAEEDDED